MTDKTTYDFDEYIRQGEPGKRQRAENWQIAIGLHPFGEGNTRTTAVFTIKYLKKLGFKTTNDAFKQHSWYLRDALVRANYSNTPKGISSTTVFLERFFENLLLGTNHELRNRFCHIYWREEKAEGTQQVPNKYPAST